MYLSPFRIGRTLALRKLCRTPPSLIRIVRRCLSKKIPRTGYCTNSRFCICFVFVLYLLCIPFFRLVTKVAYDLCTIPTPSPARLPGDGQIQAKIFGFLPSREAHSICNFQTAMYFSALNPSTSLYVSDHVILAPWT